MDGKRYRIQGANTLSLPAEDAEKLSRSATGSRAAYNLYILRSGGVLDTARRRALSPATGEQITAAGAPALRGGASHRRGRASAGTGRAAGIPHGGHIAPQRR